MTRHRYEKLITDAPLTDIVRRELGLMCRANKDRASYTLFRTIKFVRTQWLPLQPLQRGSQCVRPIPVRPCARVLNVETLITEENHSLSKCSRFHDRPTYEVKQAVSRLNESHRGRDGEEMR